ncbi:hypothetical protein B0T14DRAFT_513555 [Immersiella caudata]|uniref:Uncharacterized protein n=1 Tax=Immersiella caudata TaxID=314043 RepID=A0AA39X5Z9_9PEZI|nr:hypothetical protein B0T14DRAFT_513555 [Immersiella caudata]
MEGFHFEQLEDELPGALQPGSDPFAWLDIVETENCVMPLDRANIAPTKSLDFGRDGVTGSVSAWHELLQMTAPDDECGVIFVRGDFPDSPDSILARAQRRNQHGAFGLEVRIDEKSNYVLEPSVQNLVNMRWPYTRFNLIGPDTSPAQAAASKSKIYGYLSFCSFVRHRTLYQVIRVTPHNWLRTPGNSEVCSMSDADSACGKEGKSPLPVTVQVGGLIRMGCANTCMARPASDPPPKIPFGKRNERRFLAPTGLPETFRDQYHDVPTSAGNNGGDQTDSMSCESRNHGCQLEVRLWVNRKPIALKNEGPDLPEERTAHADDGEEPDSRAFPFFAKHDLEMKWEEPVNVIATFTLIPKNNVEDARPPLEEDMIDPRRLTNCLGVWDRPIYEFNQEWTTPYRLWSQILGETLKPSVGDSSEFCLRTVGRCLEEVLGVLTVPVPLCNIGSDWPMARPIALIRNIATCQFVELESVLWHVRLIVEAYRTASKQPCPPSVKDKGVLRQRFEFMKSQHIKDLKETLRGIFSWMVWMIPKLSDNEAWLSEMISVNCGWPSDSRPCQNWLVAFRHDGVRNHHRFYCALIIWYLICNAPFVYDKDNAAELEMLRERIKDLSRLRSPEKADVVASDDALGCLLRWYHSHCVIELAKTLGLNISYVSRPGSTAHGVAEADQAPVFPDHQKQLIHWRAKAGKAVRLYGQGRLVGQNIGHEIANHAALLGEIGATEAENLDGALPCLEYIRELVKARRDTEKVESGAPEVQRWDASHNIKSAMPRPAPWELSCLGHHLPVNLDVAPAPLDMKCMEACGEFLLADYTFIPSWDHSLAGLAGLWWDLTTSSIIATKTLHRHGSTTPGPKTDLSKAGQQSTREMKEEILHVLDRIWRQKKPDQTEGFNWKKRRPRLGPQLLYHPNTSVQSLEDTPHVYREKQTKTVNLRPHLARLIKAAALPKPDWSLETIHEALPPAELRWVSCFDYALSGRPEMPEVVIRSARGRVSCRLDVHQDMGNLARATDQSPEAILGNRQELWDLFFLGQKDMSKFPGLKLSAEQTAFLSHAREKENQDFLKRYGKLLFRVLNDSLVDLGTKYRMILTKIMPPVTLQAAVYMWHPEGIDTFDDYLGTLSHFYDTKSAGTTDDMWITSITLTHWRPQTELEGKISLSEVAIEKQLAAERRNLKATRKEEEEEDDWDSSEDEDVEQTPNSMVNEPFQFPPASVKDSRTEGGSVRNLISSISEQSISLVLTGDGMGRYWTCSLVCDLMDDHMMARCAAGVHAILQNFIQQQYTGRALVFAYLLGEICRKMAIECERFMNQIDRIMGTQRKVLVKGMHWSNPDTVVQKLKEMLWSLQALRIFDLKLEGALDKIEQAKKSLESTIDWGSELRPLRLMGEADRVMDEFNKRYGRLKNAHTAINERISQGARLRDGMGAVVSIEQNDNISLLTWITVLYLPLGLVVGLFSVEHDVVPSSFGRAEFGALLAGMVAVTFYIAFRLSFIRRNVRAAKNAVAEYYTKKFTTHFIPREGGQAQAGNSASAEEVSGESSGHSLGNMRVFSGFGATRRLRDVERGAGAEE